MDGGIEEGEGEREEGKRDEEEGEGRGGRRKEEGRTADKSRQFYPYFPSSIPLTFLELANITFYKGNKILNAD